TACSGAGAAAGFGIFNWIAMTKAQLAAAGGVVIVAGTVALIVFHRDDSMLTVEAAESIQAGQTAVTGGEQDMASASEQPGAAPSIAALSQNQTAEIVTAAEAQKEVSSIVEDWEGLASIFDDVEIYTKQIKRLTEIGPAATPPLCAALEKTTRDAPLRLIPFALRAIGDARAIPALIRTIQKTLRPSGSDCGINVTDVEVLRFMQGNDVSTVEGYAKDRVAGFDMARPVREVAASLHKLTRTNLNEAEIFQTFLEGGEPQRAAQRMAYYRVANNWANWWKENAGRFVQDASTNDVELSIAMPPTSKAQSSNQGFLTGPNIKLTGGTSGAVLRPVEYGTNCALQLTVGRRINLPSELLKTATASLRAVEDWAMSAGADLAGGQYSDGDSTKAYFALQGIGMQAWEVSNESWGEIEKILERGAFPTLGRRAGDWLMKYDEVQNHYRPEKKATFVFITRDGLQGILRVTAQVTESSAPRTGLLYIPPDESGEDQRTTSGFESGVQFDYRFFYAETDELKSEEAARRQATSEREAARKERKMARLFEAHPKIGGTVRLPNGEPARGAQVLLAVPGEGAVLGRQGFENAGYITMVETRADGRFEIPHVPSARRIYAAHADGFAEVNIDDTPPPFSIQLKRWGAIAGRVERGGKASPHAKVAIISGYVEPGTALTLSFYQIDADAEGRFAFTNLPPGEIQICRVLKNTFYEGQITSVIAGETTSIRLGSEGRTVKGRFRTSDNSAAEWSKNPGFYFHPKEQQRSEAESAKPRRMTRMPVHVSSDGEFRIEDVVPGVYDFRGDLREGAGNDDWQFGRTLGRFKQELIVPDGRGDFDVGEITVEMLGNP
ncbi:MAG TPA: carboxypeptidase-like regulatory domain-containing protein, partial [Verrucomicrobiae bacterium]|nr:carboxypeptidase-like regulatory domain-containing protein [Verrucomicrobiae bacterium]